MPVDLPMDEEQQQVIDTPATEEVIPNALTLHEALMLAATHTRSGRSGRAIRLTQQYTDSLSQREQGLLAWEVLMDQDESEKAPAAEMQYLLQQAMADLIAFAALANPDVLYIHEAIKAPDRDKFIDTMGTELKGHEDMGNFMPVPLQHVPIGTNLIDMVWSMHRKQHIKTHEIYKWKACLNVHGSQQEHIVHFWETYTPIVTWQMVRFFLILSHPGLAKPSTQLCHGLPPGTCADAFVPANTGYCWPGIMKKTHALELVHNVYRKKEASCMWNQFLNEGMQEAGFMPSKWDPCLYYHILLSSSCIGSSSIYKGELSFLQPVHFCICWHDSAVLTSYLF